MQERSLRWFKVVTLGAAGFMPTLMGGVIDSASSPRLGFLLGFDALIGTQAVVLLCGLKLYVAEHRLARV